MWTPPFTATQYFFCSTVSDNDGNNEGYVFEIEANTAYTPDMAPPDSPTLTWHWTHPTTGTQVVTYEAMWEVNGQITYIMGIPFGVPEYGQLEVPYTPGQNQRIRVRGKDAQGRLGPSSEWSAMWADVFPGKPGTPDGMLTISP
jgi:hypothetical protein